MAKRARDKRRERRRAGSSRRDSQHRTGGDWTSLSLPDGIEIWQPEAKTHRIDIVPFEAGEGNPYADKGDWYYERTYWIHRGIGPNNQSFVCPAKTAATACPICDHRGKLARDPDADEKLVDSLKPKERQLWLIYDHDAKDKGVQLWDFSHWNFGRLLDKLRKEADEDEGFIIDFDDAGAGASLKVGFSEEKGGGYTYLEAYSISFRQRPNGLSEEVLGHGICLDDLLKIEDYDKLKGIFLQIEEEEEDEDEDKQEPKKEEEKPKRKGRPKGSKNKPKPEPEPEEEDEEEQEPDAKPKATVEEDDDDDDDWDNDEDNPEEEEPKPKSKKAKSKSKPKPPVEEDEEEDDDEEGWE